MKLFLSFTLTIICFMQLNAQPSAQKIDSILCEIGRKDQQVRIELNRAIQKADAEQIAYCAQTMLSVDETNQDYVKNIFQDGVPDNLSHEAYEALFLVVDHGDIKFQKRYFKPLFRLAKSGHLKLSDIATLKDRILMNSGRRQIYGTQTKAKPIVIIDQTTSRQMVNYVWAVRNPRRLNHLRANVGLSTIEQQQQAHAQLGYESIYNPKLSKKQIITLTFMPKQ